MITSCDTMVALPDATRGRHTVFSKNSDRPAEECQPLEQRKRAFHRNGGSVGCQYVDVPQVRSTFAHVGSRPYWGWGYEHGFNEHQVVIGNEALPSKLPAAKEPRLFGMELVRLGIERGRTAAHAVDVMTSLISKYGQGKFEGVEVGSYDNSFIVADPREAYVVETAGREWAVKRVESTVGISNVYSLSTDWDRVSPDAEATAVEGGWWEPGSGKLDFGGAYGELPASQLGRSPQRQARSCAILDRSARSVDVSTMIGILRDHSDGATPDEELRTAISPTRSICTHYSDSVKSNTVASLVADLCSDGSRVPVYWCSLYSPCLSVFLPMFLEGEIPHELALGGQSPSDDSPWWVFRNIERKVRPGDDFDAQVVGQIRARWTDLQDELLRTAYDRASRAGTLIDEGEEGQLSRMLTEYMRENFDRSMVIARGILADL